MLLLDSGRDSFQQGSFEFLNVLGLIEVQKVFLSLISRLRQPRFMEL